MKITIRRFTKEDLSSFYGTMSRRAVLRSTLEMKPTSHQVSRLLKRVTSWRERALSGRSLFIDYRDNWKGDVERMLEYEPRGCFVVRLDGKPAGHVFTISYDKLGWIGMLAVKPEIRRRGIGKRLAKRALEYLLDLHVETIGLDSSPMAFEMYRALGFVHMFDSLRFVGKGGKIKGDKNSVDPMTRRDVFQVAEFDVHYFGGNRHKVLARLFEDQPDMCFLKRSKSHVVGYAMCRRRKEGYSIGPMVCKASDPEIARILLARCIEVAGHGTTLYAGIPSINTRAVNLMREFGFRQYSKSYRMLFGAENKRGNSGGIFCIGGSEKG